MSGLEIYGLGVLIMTVCMFIALCLSNDVGPSPLDWYNVLILFGLALMCGLAWPIFLLILFIVFLVKVLDF